MRHTLLFLAIPIVLNSGLAGQNARTFEDRPVFENRQKPDYLNRTFWGKAGIATLEVFAMETFTTTVMILLPRDITHWEEK